MTLYFAAVTSVQDGAIGEVELVHSTEDHAAQTITTITVYVRREALSLVLPDTEP